MLLFGYILYSIIFFVLQNGYLKVNHDIYQTQCEELAESREETKRYYKLYIFDQFILQKSNWTIGSLMITSVYKLIARIITQYDFMKIIVLLS